MSEERLDHLLSAWQEQQRQGHNVPATELCRDQPELAVELERRIAALRRMNDLARQEVETLPPPSRPARAPPWLPAFALAPPVMASASPATRSWARWAGAAWGSSTRRGRRSSAAPWR